MSIIDSFAKIYLKISRRTLLKLEAQEASRFEEVTIKGLKFYVPSHYVKLIENSLSYLEFKDLSASNLIKSKLRAVYATSCPMPIGASAGIAFIGSNYSPSEMDVDTWNDLLVYLYHHALICDLINKGAHSAIFSKSRYRHVIHEKEQNLLAALESR
jgi:hypothetical protein